MSLSKNEDDEIHLRTGRFGPYVQRGEVSEDVPKPPRASLPKGWHAADMDLEDAKSRKTHLLSMTYKISCRKCNKLPKKGKKCFQILLAS